MLPRRGIWRETAEILQALGASAVRNQESRLLRFPWIAKWVLQPGFAGQFSLPRYELPVS
jgi:hypothetical protein